MVRLLSSEGFSDGYGAASAADIGDLAYLEDAEPHRGGCGFPARAHAELAQHRRDVMIDGAPRQHELLRDVCVAQACRDELQHLELPCGQGARIGARPRPRPPRHGRAEAAEPFAREASRGARPDPVELLEALADV